MDPIGEGLFAQGRSCFRPPLFCGINFSHWKILMKMFVIDQDIELWDFITKGSKVPIKRTQMEKMFKSRNLNAHKVIWKPFPRTI